MLHKRRRYTQDTDISNTVPTATRISLYPETNPDIIQRETLHTQDSDIIPNNVPAASQPSFDTEISPNITLTETLHTQDSDITPSPQTDSLQTVETPANIITQISVNGSENSQPQIYKGEKQAQDDIFNEDPCMISHSCLPINRYGDKANRHGYQACQALRKDKHAYKTTPYRHFSDTVQNILNELWKTIDDRRKVLGKFHGDSYEHRRRTFAKAATALKRTVEMNGVPEGLRHIPGGDVFMQIQTGDLHVYFSKQLTEAAIRAARETFPEARLQGCAFHLAQSWNRMAVNLGVRNKLRGMLSRRTSLPFEELLQCLHSINSVAFGTLYHVKENAQASKVLRRRDQQRRDNINQEMAEFKQLLTSSESSHTDIIIDYCRKMSRCVAEKTI
ncbi:unnamed protein product [Cylicocyclus nassatus]|uniref:MULE transposase domain-containing protein n=1 Tax=Cylicocyclus nassatus TaxID=53992 RepID=A0AA36H7H5_CYLNA|nr:unnamed protein product [Cylicocyclus nassatus]